MLPFRLGACIQMKTKGIFLIALSVWVPAPCKLYVLREFSGWAEQLAWQLRLKEAKWFGPHRSRALIKSMEIKSKAPAFKNRRLGHPPIQNHSKPGPKSAPPAQNDSESAND